MKKKILIFSAGPASREVFQLIESINKFREAWEVIGYVDDDPKKVGKNIDNVKVYSSINKPKQSEIYAICGISNIPLRKKIFEEEIIKNKFQLTNLIHPLVEIPTSFKIGFGNIIFGNVHISFEVSIKNFSLISNYCDLGHNLIANSYFIAMPSVVIGGNCKIGEKTFIGSGAKIHQGLNIGSNCKIGMGALITSDIKNNMSVIDYPRKTIKENS